MSSIPITGAAASALLWALACSTPPAEPQFDVFEQSISQLQEAMSASVVTSRQITEQYLARIEAFDQQGPSINSIIEINESALDQAEALDRERVESGPRGPLHGIPVVVKDNYDVAGLPTTAGSIALAEWRPPDDAFQVARLNEAGAVIIAKTNMHELAFGIETISSLGGQTRNPYDPSRNPGGSSGGTGAAVAASFAAAGMGSDTCGSIRIPSAHHALVGLRGTRGLSSRDGIIPLALTQDMGGPLTRSVEDLAIMLDATVGVDPADAVTELGRDHIPATYTDYLREGALEGARIGSLKSPLDPFGSEPEDPRVRRVIDAALATMEAAGAEVIEIDIPVLRELLPGASLEVRELKAQLADYLSTPGTPVKSLDEILAKGLYHEALEGRYRRAADAPGLDDPEYLEVVERRDAVRRAVLAIMETQQLDTIAYPTIRSTAKPIGIPQQGTNCGLASVSGLPAIVVPAGFADDGMPVGLEMLGPAWAEGELIRWAYSYEQLTHHRRPPSTSPSLYADPTMSGEWVATGADHIPPIDTQVTASLQLHWNPVTSQLSYEAQVSGVNEVDVLFMHLHRAESGDIGPVSVILSGPGETRASGVVRLTPAQQAALDSGELYFDAHTTERLAGSVRAQIVRSGD